MKSAAKLIRRFVSILLLSAVLLVIINVAVYAVLVSEKAPTETTSPYDIAEKAGRHCGSCRMAHTVFRKRYLLN